MAKILEIAELGQEVLRQRAAEINNIQDPGVQELIDDMIVTCAHANGVGLAAPQVFESKRIFIVSSHPNDRYPNAPEMNPTAVLNPEILSVSENKLIDWEGCLSIPGIRGLVPRHQSIRVKYTTRHGGTIETEYSDFIARIFQHEFDHINGVVFPDRMETSHDLVTEKEYRRILSEKG